MVKNLAANAGDVRDTGSIAGSGRSGGGTAGSYCGLCTSLCQELFDRTGCAGWLCLRMGIKSVNLYGGR